MGERQYNLSIFKIRQDNESSVIPRQENQTSEYQRWAEREGIDLELTPPYTHQPNGSIERAGREIIERSIKMREGAGFPPNLWPEAIEAAAHLHNMSPLARRHFKSPNEVLHSWFRQYFRYYDPAIVKARTVDLRPDWSKIYAYGARAYPMMRDREATRHKRAFKVLPRGHVGYLVGYCAPNIYKIWVPKLKRVIISRNVVFDESKFYSSEAENANPMSTQDLRETVDFIEDAEDDGAQDAEYQTIVGGLDGDVNELNSMHLENTDIVEELLSHPGGPPADSQEGSGGPPPPPPGPSPSSGPSGNPPRPMVEDEGEEDPMEVDNLEPLSGVEDPMEVEDSNPRGDEPPSGVDDSSAQSSGVMVPYKGGLDKATTDEYEYEIENPRLDVNREYAKYIGKTLTDAREASNGQGAPRRSLRLAKSITAGQNTTEQDSGRASVAGMKVSLCEGARNLTPQVVNTSRRPADQAQDRPRIEQVPTRLLLEAAPRLTTEEEQTIRRTSRGKSELPAPSGTLKVPEGAKRPRTNSKEHWRDRPNVYATTCDIIRPQFNQSTNSQVDDFISTFWTNEPIQVDGKDLQAVHAVVAASMGGEAVRKVQPPDLKQHRDNLPRAPKHWNDLKNHQLGEQFREGARTEIRNLESRQCWRVIPRDENMKPIPLKWVFTYKTNSSGELQRCRSRLVVRGDLQDEASIFSTYAATLAARSFRTVMALAAHFDLEVKQFDVVNAFVNAKRDSKSKPVTCYLPDGFKQPGMVVQLDRALYGLKDSPALWYGEFAGTLKKLSLKPLGEEPCIFTDESQSVFVAFYVDDIQVLYHATHTKKATRIIEGLKTAYELTSMGDLNYFLGMRVVRDRQKKSVTLLHDSYIEKIATKFGAS